MDNYSRNILVAAIVIIFAMFAYPPFQVVANNGVIINMGYEWIFSPPKKNGIVAIVNTNMLLIQWLGVMLVGGATFLLTKYRRPANETDKLISSNHIESNSAVSNKTSGNNNTSATQLPSGVGGWLLLLVVGMMVIGPFMGAGAIANTISEIEKEHSQIIDISQWKTYKTATWLIFVIGAGACFYGGLKLITTKTQTTIKQVKIILWLSGPISIIALWTIPELIAYGTITEAITNDSKNELFKGLLKSITATIIWTLYLTKSIRVKNTYKPTIQEPVFRVVSAPPENTRTQCKRGGNNQVEIDLENKLPVGPSAATVTIGFLLIWIGIAYSLIVIVGKTSDTTSMSGQANTPQHETRSTNAPTTPARQQPRDDDLHKLESRQTLQAERIRRELEGLRHLPWQESEDELNTILSWFDDLSEYGENGSITYKGACMQGVRLFEDKNSPPCRKGSRFDLVEKCYWNSPEGRSINRLELEKAFNSMARSPENSFLTCWSLILKADAQARSTRRAD